MSKYGFKIEGPFMLTNRKGIRVKRWIVSGMMTIGRDLDLIEHQCRTEREALLTLSQMESSEDHARSCRAEQHAARLADVNAYLAVRAARRAETDRQGSLF